MKNILAIIGGVFILFSVMSYTATDGNDYKYNRTVVPLKQKGVIVTKNIEYVNRLMKKGWVVQDVDVTGHDYYTLIKY